MVINNITTVCNKTIATTRVKGDIRREGSAKAPPALVHSRGVDVETEDRSSVSAGGIIP